jgi:N-acetylmuramoyl-L-alanine amidase
MRSARRTAGAPSARAAGALIVLAGIGLLAGCGTAGAPRRLQPSAIAAAAPAPASVSRSTSIPTPAPASSTAPNRPDAQVAGTVPVGRPARSSSPRKPRIVWDPVPFGPRRKAQMVAYVRRHYSSFMKPTWRLIDPHVIVIHYTEASFSSTYNTFANDIPDSELHELPTTCAHFVINTEGTIYQLVSLTTMCRHTVGLNWTAIGIEHVGYSDAQVLGDKRQMSASLRLTRWLRCRFKIASKNVIGHNESLSSPYHHEDVPTLRTQTHSDFDHYDMQIYRARLAQLGGC